MPVQGLMGTLKQELQLELRKVMAEHRVAEAVDKWKVSHQTETASGKVRNSKEGIRWNEANSTPSAVVAKEKVRLPHGRGPSQTSPYINGHRLGALRLHNDIVSSPNSSTPIGSWVPGQYKSPTGSRKDSHL